MAKSVFYSFHYDRDVHRVQLIRNINALEGQAVLNGQDWEKLQRSGSDAIQQWIDGQMSYKKAVIVLIGQQTASRPWVQYEIKKAWADRKPLLGICIHGLSSLGQVDSPGADPFKKAGLTGVPVFDPTVRAWNGVVDSKATYRNLASRLEGWSAQGVTKPKW
ncbi:TIR domain-containing protein [Phycicoccus sp. SLBN-51]|uniref:TIR domain-containing protein n=1 Tax=Phycicoccus sp. SLBN-51 TaxID=2768447 RepID=UPI0011734177|nr:TIR domain-containing protein [Phycicoccus sp. SLBN-51]TQJ52236.1 TIR-like protein DUF1863 [Phycicoccus sp. SLBN-51]